MTPTPLLGSSDEHRRVMQLVEAAAQTDAEVLLLGPSGVGKELYARRIHERSPRSEASFVPVNCGALPPDLFENEVFGHVCGAFTGARRQAAGLVAEAHRGTLFLDEIDALPLASQVKLLRLVQEKEYRPLGDPRVRRVDVRFIAASNADLLAEARAGRFRLDLFFRLRVLPIAVPPLSERSGDVTVLLDHFVGRYAAEYRVAPVEFTPRALEALQAYAWPGNVRELENCVRFLLCTMAGKTVDEGQLPLLERDEPSDAPAPAAVGPFRSAKHALVSSFERTYVERMLSRHGGNVAAAARDAGKNRRAFFELMRRHGLTATAFRNGRT